MSPRRARPRRSWPQRLLVGVGVIVSLAMGGAVYAINLAQDRASDVQRIAIAGDVLAEEVTIAEPRNILVVGIDSADGLDPDDPRAVGRPDSILTDTMMIVRVDPAAESVSILSIPRDLWVSISGREEKINAAVAMGGGPEAGGVSLLIETIEENFGIPINNFVQVDFATFIGIVDAIDGVPFYFPTRIRDTQVGLQIRAGCNVVGPDDSLAYVRSRSLEEFIDDEWVNDGIAPDLKRIERQQAFVVAMVERAIAKGARNPITLNELINATLDDVVLDTRLTPADLLELGSQFREFRTENLESFTFDGLYDIEVRGVSALAMNDTPHNALVIARFAGAPAPASGTEGGDGSDSSQGPAAPADSDVGATPTATPPPTADAAVPTPDATLAPESTPTPQAPTCS